MGHGPFDIGAFARTNRSFLIWAAFLCILYVLWDILALIFITFVMGFISEGATLRLQKVLKIPRKALVTALYLVFLVLMGAFLVFLGPAVLEEARNFTAQLPNAIHALSERLAEIPVARTWMDEVTAQIQELSPSHVLTQGWSVARGLLERSFRYASWFFLGLLFSFMIVLDLPRIRQGITGLRSTRLAPVYDELADRVLLFADVVGATFRAQMLTSAINTLLIAAFLLVMGIGNVVLLSFLVFLCGLIPVVGIIFSSVPIILTAVNSGGPALGGWSLGMIVLASLAETYIITPRIMSSVMRLNPVLAVIILYFAYTLMGIWGMVIGIPLAVYIFQEIQRTPGKKETAAPGPL